MDKVLSRNYNASESIVCAVAHCIDKLFGGRKLEEYDGYLK